MRYVSMGTLAHIMWAGENVTVGQCNTIQCMHCSMSANSSIIWSWGRATAHGGQWNHRESNRTDWLVYAYGSCHEVEERQSGHLCKPVLHGVLHTLAGSTVLPQVDFGISQWIQEAQSWTPSSTFQSILLQEAPIWNYQCAWNLSRQDGTTLETKTKHDEHYKKLSMHTSSIWTEVEQGNPS